MIDSNVIIPALVFKSANMARAIERICAEHELCIASHCLDEVRELMVSKFANATETLDEFFAGIPYTLLPTPDDPGVPLFNIRDKDDYLVLHTAVVC
jgi:predicted nucleic acid-binding protein